MTSNHPEGSGIRPILRGALRQPFVIFLAGAAAIFLFDVIRSGVTGGGQPDIFVSDVEISKLSMEWERRWARPPTEEELEGLVEDWLQDEVLYRQAIALGLDNEDPVIRRYLGNKMRFLVQDSVIVPEPGEQALRVFYEAHADEFASDPVYTFREIRLPDESGAAAEPLLAALQAGAPATDGSASEMSAASRLDISRRFGVTFYESLAELRLGEWNGPVVSAQGVHIVRVERVERAPPPDFNSVRDEVFKAWTNQQRLEREQAEFDRLQDEYDVRTEGVTGQ